MHSGELAKLTGVSTDTLRHYERLGLLAAPARTTGNYREYPASAQQRVTLIQRALRISFSLKELKTIHPRYPRFRRASLPRGARPNAAEAQGP